MSARPGSASLRWTGVVLAGGASRRFGGLDKTRLPLGGRTLRQRALDALAPLTTRQIVVGGSADHPGETWPDRYPGDGPLGGILTALEAIDTTHALVVAADLPFLSDALLKTLQRAGADAPVAFLRHADGRLALCLSVARAVAPQVREAWAQGTRRVRLLADVPGAVVVPVDEATARGALWNVNDPLTYARALEMAEHDCPAC